MNHIMISLDFDVIFGQKKATIKRSLNYLTFRKKFRIIIITLIK